MLAEEEAGLLLATWYRDRNTRTRIVSGVFRLRTSVSNSWVMRSTNACAVGPTLSMTGAIAMKQSESTLKSSSVVHRSTCAWKAGRAAGRIRRPVWLGTETATHHFDNAVNEKSRIRVKDVRKVECKRGSHGKTWNFLKQSRTEVRTSSGSWEAAFSTPSTRVQNLGCFFTAYVRY